MKKTYVFLLILMLTVATAFNTAASDFKNYLTAFERVDHIRKDQDMMTAFARDGESSEFLYAASTLEELEKGGFQAFAYQTFNANF